MTLQMVTALLLGAGMFMTASPARADEGRERFATTLMKRFQPAQIDLESGGRDRGAVRGGQLLVLLADAVPAKPFRIIQADRKSPAVHVMDFAVVEIGRGGRVRAIVQPLRISRGDRLVVLDVTVTATDVRLQTHTSEPIRSVSSRESVYGCTEFVFDVGADLISAGDVEAVLQRIETVLQWTPAERVCAPGIHQLCLEP